LKNTTLHSRNLVNLRTQPTLLTLQSHFSALAIVQLSMLHLF
jgi:hypothetical protein